MSKTIHYFFAPQSPYVYLGHERLLKLGAQYGAMIEPKPFDIGAVFAETGGLPLAKRAPQRQAYRLQELERWSRHLGLPMNLQPKFFPVDQKPASLLLVAARDEKGADQALELATAIVRAVWAEEKNIADPATLEQLAGDAGYDAAALLDASRAPETQRKYDAFTQEALAAGVFGAPWYVVDGQGFWGQDRLDFVERLLQV
ncbi:2-hydroxychromene-2-carboxylate isomerase [Massilia sp. WG5]|uniref:2-hydroxychromene-2-carboxylate isomerase n=1 Tax=Massilia sp. WG5 TaxID=1707785 RepID=UPI00070631B5|nr:2-hydroxychromene-2-carboxylate isomerase [Massilia sp. WG5]ALK99105.1 2-hydroxychromene-2-carboxylate isomerase [Massilia sp. WG5]